MNDLTFGAALLSLFVTLAAAVLHEAFSAATPASLQPTVVAHPAPREQQVALLPPVECIKVADASAVN